MTTLPKLRAAVNFNLNRGKQRQLLGRRGNFIDMYSQKEIHYLTYRTNNRHITCIWLRKGLHPSAYRSKSNGNIEINFYHQHWEKNLHRFCHGEISPRYMWCCLHCRERRLPLSTFEQLPLVLLPFLPGKQHPCWTHWEKNKKSAT